MESPNASADHQKTKLESPQLGDRNKDKLWIKEVRDTSIDSGNCTIPFVKPLLNIIDAIFNRAAADPPGFIEGSLTRDMAAIQVPESMYDELPTRVIIAISSEIFSKCRVGVDVHMITMEILQITKHYNWDAKVVLALVAFAVTFCEFPLLVQLYATNPVAKAIALLKQLPEVILEHGLVDAFFSLIGEILDVTEKIVEFYDFPLHNYFTAESPEVIAAHSFIPVAVYWTIRSIVVSLTQILAFTFKENVFLKREQSESGQKLNNIKGHLVELIECCNRYTESKTTDGYHDMVRILGSSNVDNSNSLKILFDKPGLYDCYNKKKISNDDLKSKVVALFITNLDSDLITGAEYAILQQTYLEKWHNPASPASKYEVVWVPIVDTNDWSREKLELFKGLRDQMEWHSVDNPSDMDLVVIRFIIEQLNFLENPLLVVMDTHGKIVHTNGIYMMGTWGSLAYPFSTRRERLLWEEMSWSIDLLVDNMEMNMDIWIHEEKCICLYGGDDVKWIRKFTKAAKDVANVAAIGLELLFVGRSKLKKRLVNIIDIIQKENLSRTLDWNILWYFWVRLESMLCSKKLTQRGTCDIIMQGIIALLSYDSEHRNWAIISNGTGKMVVANGEHMLRGLRQLWKMKSRENNTGFVDALDEYICKTYPATAAPDKYASDILTATGETSVPKKDYEVFKVVERILVSTNIHDSKSRGIKLPYKYGHRAVNSFYNKKRISNNNLRRKIVVLFITDLEPGLKYGLEYATLQEIYLEKWHNPTRTESQYDLVWVPVVDLWVSEKNKLFESLRGLMEWFSVYHPLMVPLEVIRYIKEKWNFSKKPQVVVMDTQGKIVHTNAIHMMCIWRSQAYPFSTAQEKLMWEKTSWSIDLLVDDLEPNMATWLQEGRHICLYGGEDMEWIRKFTTIAKDMAREASIRLELLYVGRSNPNEKVETIIETIHKENLSRTLEWNLIWYFWMRLESMWQSKREMPKSKNVMSDPIIQGITEMQSYGSIEQGWAVISEGLGKMISGNGEDMFKALAEHNKWKSRKDEIGFVAALDEYLHTMQLNLLQHEKKKDDEANFEAVEQIFEASHINIDNSKPLNALFHYKDGQPALYDSYNNIRITTEELRGKIIVMFITDLDPELRDEPDYVILHQVHVEKRLSPSRDESQYEVVWVPIADNWTDEKYKSFETLRGHMQWLSIHHPSVVSPMVIRYIKEKWNFHKKPMLVVMNTQGEIVHRNAMSMMCIWGSEAYPFSTDREKILWENMSWSIELLVYNLDQNINTGLQEGKHICLYGGEDMEWIRKFVRTAKDVARVAGITLELSYVGMRKVEERPLIKSIIDRIQKDYLMGRTFDLYLIWYFWTRLESMWNSKLGQQINNDGNTNKDPIMQGIAAMLSYGSSDEQGWAVICGGSREIVMGNGEDMLTVLVDHHLWKLREGQIGFVAAFNEYLHRMQLNRLQRDLEILGRNFIAQTDNSKALSALFQYKDGQPALYNCYNKRRATVEELRGKIVALFITDLDPAFVSGSAFEYAVLQQMYLEKRHSSTRSESQYEVVWVPIVDNISLDDEKNYRSFEMMRDQMEWHSIHHPSVVSPIVIRYIKEKWNFDKNPMVVVMDKKGEIVHHNAIHMMCIWGSISYPFSTNREKLLWEETIWSIDILVDGLDPNVSIWIQEGRYICLYGGEDVEWIRKFTRAAKEVAREAGINLELLYVGMIELKENERKMRRIMEIICKENLSRTLDPIIIWYFWVRVESMLYSKEQLTKEDPIMERVFEMLSYGSNQKGWALICRGLGEMVVGNGEHMFQVLLEHGRWLQREQEIGFVPALDEYLRKIQHSLPHRATEYPATRSMPRFMVCSDCGRVMNKYFVFR
ncbi:Sieve element occlusion [Trema orientale]|uniref:Sieve element occlusion n=1 Tax=Trema orientale TaxID=63057 RepID=A0A2P5DMY0_TREOI|nr:Sieve element occlusion [Trema orientale]